MPRCSFLAAIDSTFLALEAHVGEAVTPRVATRHSKLPTILEALLAGTVSRILKLYMPRDGIPKASPKGVIPVHKTLA